MTSYPRTPPASYDPTPTWDVSPIAPFQSGAFQDIGHPDGTWSPWFGHGRVDAQAAVARAIALARGATQAVVGSSSPERPIPDNDPAGIRDTIQIGASGRVQDVRVSVNVAHSWIGDLRVLLVSPSGASAILHDRGGADADNINRTFAVADTPTLAAFRATDPNGAWTLEIRDLAAADVGILKSWSLQLAVDKTLALTDTVSVPIPDNTPAGVTRSVAVTAPTPIADVAVTVDITHTWIGDLRIELLPPGGSSPIVLHDRSGGDADNIIRSYRASEIPGLASLRGQDAKGQWQLRVADLEGGDTGKLNRWSLDITS